jgi:hypothetical protein
MLNHTSLENHYQTIFGLVQHHKYSIEELENLLPYELDIYVTFLIEYIKKKEEASKNK